MTYCGMLVDVPMMSMLPPSATAAVFVNSGRPTGQTQIAAFGRGFGLTPAECRVLGRLVAGETTGQAALALGVAEGTVKTHVKRVLMKLGLRDRVQAVIFAYETGLIRPGSTA